MLRATTLTRRVTCRFGNPNAGTAPNVMDQFTNYARSQAFNSNGGGAFRRGTVKAKKFHEDPLTGLPHRNNVRVMFAGDKTRRFERYLRADVAVARAANSKKFVILTGGTEAGGGSASTSAAGASRSGSANGASTHR
jgi:hypothetical protein